MFCLLKTKINYLPAMWAVILTASYLNGHILLLTKWTRLKGTHKHCNWKKKNTSVNCMLKAIMISEGFVAFG